MSAERRRQLTIIVLVILSLGLFGAFIFVSNALQQNQAPSDASAASALTECILTKRPDILPFYARNGWDTGAGNHDAIVANWRQIAGAGEYDSVAAQCAVAAAAPPAAQTPTPTPNPPAANAAATKTCGEACTTSSDCKAPTGEGTAICRSGKCENSLCPAGFTITGTICNCSYENHCGQQCSSGRGLCDGISVCTFLVGSSTSCAGTNNNTYCVPATTYASLSRCTGNNTTDKFYTGGQSGLSALCNPSVGGVTAPPPASPLPNTAVVSDEADRIIIGALLLGFGIIVLIYHKRHFHSKL